MSMYEYEDLVEESVRMLARSQRHSPNELRSLYWNLYEFEGLWDTSFTQLRTLDLLLAAHYTYRFDLSAHPDYERYPELFQNIHQFSWINVHPEQEYDRQDNPTAGYCDPPYLYCDVNSQLWYRFVQLGVLTGEDALPVERQDPIDVARIVVEDALNEEHYHLIASWYYLISPYLAFLEDTEMFYSHPSLLQIKHLFYQTKACYVNLSPSFLHHYRPKPEDLVDEDGNPLSLLIWWFNE